MCHLNYLFFEALMKRPNPSHPTKYKSRPFPTQPRLSSLYQPDKYIENPTSQPDTPLQISTAFKLNYPLYLSVFHHTPKPNKLSRFHFLHHQQQQTKSSQWQPPQPPPPPQPRRLLPLSTLPTRTWSLMPSALLGSVTDLRKSFSHLFDAFFRSDIY